ncbi:MAG: hypothetical protein AABZ53_06465 [Planctomycetota bacterium]
MTDSPAHADNPSGTLEARLRCSDAKARLLSWADEVDAQTRQTRGSLGAIAVRSGLAVLGGMMLGRLILGRGASQADRAELPRTGRRLVSAAVLLRAGAWLLPRVVRACQGRRKDRALA